MPSPSRRERASPQFAVPVMICMTLFPGVTLSPAAPQSHAHAPSVVAIRCFLARRNTSVGLTQLKEPVIPRSVFAMPVTV